MSEAIEIPKVPTAEEIEIAQKLVSEDDVLKNDLHVHEVLKNGGFLANGNSVGDIGDFLQGRRDKVLDPTEINPDVLAESMASHSETWVSKEQNQ